jgi:hypothetical protein
MSLTRLLLFIIKFMILHFFKQYIFKIIDFIEKNSKSIDVKTMIFYAGILNEKFSMYINNYLLL